MYRWNTKKIVAYLELLTELESVVVEQPGGDVDTENIRCKVRGSDEHIYVCGFSTDDAFSYIDYEKKGNIDVEMVEITDQSGHGLQSSDFAVAQAYILVRQYFAGGGAHVVSYLKDHF